jgi:hypothetical protein
MEIASTTVLYAMESGTVEREKMKPPSVNPLRPLWLLNATTMNSCVLTENVSNYSNFVMTLLTVLTEQMKVVSVLLLTNAKDTCVQTTHAVYDGLKYATDIRNVLTEVTNRTVNCLLPTLN